MFSNCNLILLKFQLFHQLNYKEEAAVVRGCAHMNEFNIFQIILRLTEFSCRFNALKI